MHPLGKLPIHIKLGERDFSDELQIYPDECGVLYYGKLVKF